MLYAYTSTDVQRWTLIIYVFHTTSQTNLLAENMVFAFPPQSIVLMIKCYYADDIGNQIFLLSVRIKDKSFQNSDLFEMG